MKHRNPIFVALAPFLAIVILFAFLFGSIALRGPAGSAGAMSAISNIVLIFVGIFCMVLAFYPLLWLSRTYTEMNKLGAGIPSILLILVPFVNFYWFWRWSQGVEKVTNGKVSALMAFLLVILLHTIGMAIVQTGFNKVGSSPSPISTPAAGAGPSSPDPYSNALQNNPYAASLPAAQNLPSQPTSPTTVDPFAPQPAPQDPTQQQLYPPQQPPTTPA